MRSSAAVAVWLLISLVLLASSVCASVVNLTADGASGWIGDAFFLQVDPPGAQGSGNFDSFVRIQANDTESGYNTSGNLEFDTKAGAWTHIVDLQDPTDGIPVIDGATVPGLTAGVDYREILLDINETTGGSLLSLDAVRIFQSGTANNTGYPNLGTEIFNLGTGNYILLDFALNPGSGQGDMAMYLPASLFTQRYIYLYSQFGLQSGASSSNDGFEEWGVDRAHIAEPSALIALIAGLGSLRLIRCRR